MKLVNISVDKLQPLQNNPRTITAEDIERLRASIRSFGLFKPFLVWTGDDGAKYVVSGNQRLRVLKAMAANGELPVTFTLRSGAKVGITTELPCVEFAGTESEAKAVALRDNTSDGEWNWEALPGYVADLTVDFGADADLAALTGFDAAVLDDLQRLAADPHENLDFVGDPDETASEPLQRSQMRFAFGKVKGMLSLQMYEDFVSVFGAMSKRHNTKELAVLLGKMLDAVRE